MLRFYDVHSDYTDFLKKHDRQVPNIKYDGNDKFLCGVVLDLNGISYYAPVSSFTQKQRTNLLIFDKSGRTLGSLRFSFMFPAPDFVLQEKDLAVVDKDNKKYADLLRAELDYCLRMEDNIMAKANSVYTIGCNKHHPMNYLCCDFKKLEKVYTEFSF